MLAELRTSHTAYYTPAQPEYFQLLDVFSVYLADEIEARFPDGRVSYPGIGMFTRVIEGRWHVTGIVAGTPASESELDVGDAILVADGAPFEPLGSFEGKIGTPVTLSVQKSADSKERLAVAVIPERIRPTTMFLQAIEASAKRFQRDGVSVGYARIWSYAGEHYHQAFLDQLQGETLKGADALVLDLRDGWGGANPVYLNLFNRGVPVLKMRGRDGEPTTFDSQWRNPAVLLVNRGTRSGKEVLAYGFKAFGLGSVVGTRTSGAVMGGKPFVLADGSLLFLAVSDVIVDGLRLEGVGVEPDIVVPFDVRYSDGADPQLERALDVAAERVRADAGR
jgi:carboxyl-terminal processing protease